MKSRPPPQKLRQRGILRERVFGCDLGEHLHNSGHEGTLVTIVVQFLSYFPSSHSYLIAIFTHISVCLYPTIHWVHPMNQTFRN